MSRRVVVAVPDLFFAARIEATAGPLGVAIAPATFASASARCHEAPTDLVIVDLDAPGAVELVRALKADPDLRATPVLGFYPHVRTELRAAAMAAGLDRAMARSAFTTLLPALLTGGGPTR